MILRSIEVAAKLAFSSHGGGCAWNRSNMVNLADMANSANSEGTEGSGNSGRRRCHLPFWTWDRHFDI